MKAGAWLALGFAAMCVANGLTATPMGAWIGNLALLVFLDRNRTRKSVLWTAAAVMAGFQVQFVGLLPGEPIVSAGFALLYGLLFALPFVAVRLWTNDGMQRTLATLVFPCAWVSVEWLAKTLLPYGSWFSLAHVLAPDSGWAQWAAIGGTAFPAFLLAWSASLVAALLGHSGKVHFASKSMLLCLAAIAAMVIGGELRSRSGLPVSSQVRVALIAPNPGLHEAFLSSAQMPARTPTAEESHSLRDAARPLNESLLRDTRRAVAAGAEMIVWSEGAAMILETDQSRFLSNLSQWAAAHRVYLFAAFIAWTPGDPKIMRNRVAAIEPSGRIAWIYEKSRPIFGFESQTTPYGDAAPRYLQTPWGLVGLAICHDVDFPSFMADAGRRHVPLFLAPSNDWEAIDEFHARMAQLRAVENGFTLIRPTKGLGFVAGPTGRMRSWSNSFQERTTLQVVTVPVARIATLYPLGGEFVSYLAASGLLILLFGGPLRRLAAVRKGRPHANEAPRSAAASDT